LELRDRMTAALLARFSLPERPQVNSEQRGALVGAGIRALVESPEVPTGVRALLLGEVVTIREAVDAEPVVRVVLDAILAQLSLPVLDVEKVARLLVEHREARFADGGCEAVCGCGAILPQTFAP